MSKKNPLYKSVKVKDPSDARGYRYVQKELTAREVKQYIMKAHGWTSAEYVKARDIFKNQLKAYESFKSAHGVKVEKQSPVDIMYKEAKAIKREGADYRPTLKLQQIKSMSAVSITQGRKRASAPTSRAYQRMEKAYASFVGSRFDGLIENNEGARKLADAIEDPVKREQALIAYANELHARFDKQGKATGESNGIPQGEAIGSTTEINYEDFLPN